MKILLFFVFVVYLIEESSSQSCRDLNTRDCKFYSRYCHDFRYRSFMYSQCKWTCGRCRLPCRDIARYCAYWKSLNFCSRRYYNYRYMRINCRKTCGICSDPTKKPKTILPVTKTTPTSPKDRVELPKDCGTNKKDVGFGGIVGGSRAVANSWIWQVVITYAGEDVCGGTIITDRHILTAAHCVVYRELLDYYTVTVGDHIRDKMEGNEKEFKVTKRLYHKGYDFKTVANDIAVLKLNKAIQFNKNVGPACIPKNNPPTDAKCYITGWGTISTNGTSTNILQEARMPIVENKRCADRNEDKPSSPKVSKNNICAGFDKDSDVSGCHGDSGGPFVCKEDKIWILHGVVSWGSPTCDAAHRYTVFARVTEYNDWIIKQINM